MGSILLQERLVKRLEDQVTVERTKTRILVMQISHSAGNAGGWVWVISWDGDNSTIIRVNVRPFMFNKLELGEYYLSASG